MVDEEPQYDVVLKMVLWGEGSEAIFHRLKVNGIEGDRARLIYKKARMERLRIIRGEGFKSFLLGLVLLAAGAGIYHFCKLGDLNLEEFGDGVNGIPFLPWLLGFLAVILGFLGLWKSGWGAFEILFATSKRGSVGD